MLALKSVFSLFLLCVSRSQGRTLTQQLIAGYEPLFKVVTDHNALDLDQQAMETELGKGTTISFLAAKDLYEVGGSAMSVATLYVVGGLQFEVKRGAHVSGASYSGNNIVEGIVQDDAMEGDTALTVKYVTSDVQQFHSNCKVGGLWNPDLSGCFAGGTGKVSINGYEVEYEYSVLEDNTNQISLQLLEFSNELLDTEDEQEEDDSKAVDSQHTSKSFMKYYDTSEYADAIIGAAFDGSVASINETKFDFTAYPLKARAEVIKKSTVNLAFASQVVNRLSQAIGQCRSYDNVENEEAVASLDIAVAYYTGSLEGRDGLGDGVLLYNQADLHCAHFRTCSDTTADSVRGISKINLDIFQQFELMKEHLLDSKCDAAEATLLKIEPKLYVPMVQGALRSAYTQEDDVDSDEFEQARGVAYAAAIIPAVAMCSLQDADIIYENLGTQSGFYASFPTVKSALERNYDCMGITCEDVGGYYNRALGEYHENAHPCTTNRFGIDRGAGIGLLTGFILLLVLLGLLLIRLCCGCCSKRRFSSDERVGSCGSPPAAVTGLPLPRSATEEHEVVFKSVDADHV